MIGHLLTTTATVYRATFAADGAGGRTKTMAAVGTIRAQVAQPTAVEREVAARMGAMLTHVVHTTVGANVGRGDELDIGGPRRLRVLDAVENSQQTYTRLDCEVVQGG